MQRYKLKKEISAVRITHIGYADPTDITKGINLSGVHPDGGTFTTILSARYVNNNDPEVGGYYVTDGLGNDSYLSEDYFEANYEAID